MTRARPKFTPTPRVWNEFQLACRLGKSQPWLKSNRDRLEAEGFPQPDPRLGGTDADGVESWLDRLSGIANGALAGAGDPLMEALNDRQN